MAESSPQYISKPPRKRSVNVCTLDDATLKNLNDAFARFDTSGTGELSHAEVRVLVKESYEPTEEQVSNVFAHLNVKQDDLVVFEEFMLGFQSLFCDVKDNPEATSFDFVYEQYETQLHAISKQGASKGGLECTEAVCAQAMEEIGEEWIVLLRDRFKSFSEAGDDTQLSKLDMQKLLKVAFTPSEDKIAKVMAFFDMTGGGGDITLQNFINGMTLLYGDLGNLAASPTLKNRPKEGAAGVEVQEPPAEGCSPGSPFSMGLS